MKRIIFFLVLFWGFGTIFAQSWKIYIDADFTGAKESSEAIKKGIELAIDNYRPKNIELQIIIKNHRGNSRRSLSHLKEFYNDPQGLVIFCGLHSPPVLANLNYINEKKIVLLDPWAAATPITRSIDKNGNNWVFRLSIDDSQAGEVITSYAVDLEGFKKPILLFEDTGWGKANEKTFKKALNNRGINIPTILWFDWQLGSIGAKEIMSDILIYKPDVIFLVANAIEGETLLKEISKNKVQIPVRSHWGITGGDLFSKLERDLIAGKLDLEFIQTSFQFTNKDMTPYQKEIWKLIKQKYNDIKNFKDLKAPLGLIHAYDLTKLLLITLPNIDTSLSIFDQRNMLRKELENINKPILGLIKTYNNPFNSNGDSFSHEALNIEDFTMGYYNNEGEIILRE